MTKAPTPEEMLKKLGLSNETTLLDDDIVEEPKIKKAEEIIKNKVPEFKEPKKPDIKPLQNQEFAKVKVAKSKKVGKNNKIKLPKSLTGGKYGRSVLRHERYEKEKTQKNFEEMLAKASETIIPTESVQDAYNKKDIPSPLSQTGEDYVSENIEVIMARLMIGAIEQQGSYTRDIRLAAAKEIFAKWDEVKQYKKFTEDDISRIQDAIAGIFYGSKQEQINEATRTILEILDNGENKIDTNLQDNINILYDDSIQDELI